MHRTTATMVSRGIGCVLALVISALAACGSSGTAPTAPTPVASRSSLYERLGGKAAIALVVEDFVANVVANDAINAYFQNTDAPRLKAHLVDQICEATGGPCTYTGKPMAEVHTAMKITSADFDALVGDLQRSLDKFRVGPREQHELLTALGGMKDQIVGR